LKGKKRGLCARGKGRKNNNLAPEEKKSTVFNKGRGGPTKKKVTGRKQGRPKFGLDEKKKKK